MAGPAERGVATAAGLLERVAQLGALDAAFDEVSGSGTGRLVLVAGEAGIGKTSVVRAFCSAHEAAARVLWGVCDGLFTPRALGPFVDVGEAAGGELAALVAREATPRDVLGALLDELRREPPAILVVEDLHWADEATLDVLRLLARRIEGVPALAVATFRDDEVDAAHPLRIVVGELATEAAVLRIDLPRLSRSAVWELAEPAGVDSDELYRQTAGNPFFVTEVLAAGDRTIPPTVRDAVLARAARLRPEARALLEAVAVVPSELELWLLEAVAEEHLGGLDECVASGMLRYERGRLGFRHELARLALLDSIGEHRRVALHRAVLRALADPPAGAPELARLAHHAEEAGDAEAVLRWAPAAAERAAAVGAHREAARQYERAMRYADLLPVEQRGRLLDACSYECYLSDRPDDAIEVRRSAVTCHRVAGERLREGESLAWLSRLLLFNSHMDEADSVAALAVELLETLPPGPELAMAYSGVSHLRMLAGDEAEAVRWGERAIELAERIGDVGTLVYALNNVGSALYRSGAPEGRERLQHSLELARAAGFAEHATRAYVNIGSTAVDLRRYDVAERYLAEGTEYAREHEVAAWRWYLAAVRARLAFELGRWDEAVARSEKVCGRARYESFGHLVALTVLGRIAARRGDEPWGALDHAERIAALTGHLQQVGPVASARAEAAWLEGTPARVDIESAAVLESALARGDPWLAGDLSLWRSKAGLDVPPGDRLAEPYALHLAGDPAAAAARWDELRCPYEAAVARSDCDEADELRRALETARELGAAPLTAAVEARLRALGVRGVRRGPRAATRANPAGLTARQLEVLALLAAGRTNAEIAARLVLSPKTVEHHVSAILRKLGLSSRAEAREAAARLGIELSR